MLCSKRYLCESRWVSCILEQMYSTLHAVLHLYLSAVMLCIYPVFFPEKNLSFRHLPTIQNQELNFNMISEWLLLQIWTFFFTQTGCQIPQRELWTFIQNRSKIQLVHISKGIRKSEVSLDKAHSGFNNTTVNIYKDTNKVWKDQS